MEIRNSTSITEFILIGFSQNLIVCIILFVFFLLTYSMTILGNSFLICAVITSPRMHTPMYYFLCHLSFIDLCYSSSTLPNAFLQVFSTRRSITITGCLVQMNTSLFLGCAECVLLAVMAYDRYIAIRYPLHYTMYMSWKTCNIITAIMWLGSFIVVTGTTISKPFVFCKDNRLDHFICEILAILELACGDVAFYKLTILVVCVFTILCPLLFILGSYVYIILSLLKIRSAGGRSKAFSTCASHLTVVSIFYGTIMIMYMGQTQSSVSNVKYSALIYGIMTPMLNPLIYSLRNNDVREAFNAILSKSFAICTV